MKKKMFNLLIIFVLCSVFININDVYAKSCEAVGAGNALTVSIVKNSSKKYDITVTADGSLASSFAGQKLYLVVNGPSNGQILTVGTTFKNAEINEDQVQGGGGKIHQRTVTVATCNQVDANGKCTAGAAHLSTSVCEGDFSATGEIVESDIIGDDTDGCVKLSDSLPAGLVTTAGTGIDCSNTGGDSFKEAFCSVKQKAKETGHYYNLNTGKIPEKNSFSCDYNTIFKDDELKGENYYKTQNSGYMYATETKKYELGHYSYYYSPGSKPHTEEVSCKVTCEEAVKAEYGPPVASKAGLCFEYKVRVTSYVSCYVSQAVNPPDVCAKVCTPNPYCHSRTTSWSGDRGGPNDDFYDCIESCDGGEFTDKCTKACYNEVYSSSDSTLTSDMLSYESTKLKSLSGVAYQICKNVAKNRKGCYLYSGSSGIKWESTTGRDIAGRYYGGGCPSGYIPGGNAGRTAGICYHDHGSWICNDRCSWQGRDRCKGKYLNYGFATDYVVDGKVVRKGDITSNIETYIAAVKTCNAAASCSQRTGEFTINVDYTKTGENTKTTIYFPYTKSNDANTKDTVRSRGTTAGYGGSFLTNKNTTILNGVGDNAENDKFLGCYAASGAPDNIYRVPWSFPGSWINNKTAEIAYYMEEENTLWQHQKRKFCVPADAKDVNQKWWNKYIETIYGISTGGTGSTLAGDVVTNCGPSTITSTTTLSYEDIDWNIHATTKNFGYFGWNIYMDCFYALNKIYPKTDSEVVPNKCATVGVRARAVDLKNLFPDTDGSSKGSGGTTSGGSSETGRTPGFNWSSGAVNSKNPDYASNPVALINKIQTEGYGVYNDDNLDYYFELSKETLAQMKRSVTLVGGNYTDFADSGFLDTKDTNGVVRYFSSKIRDLSGNNKYPKKGSKAINCNNMVNYGSEECEG